MSAASKKRSPGRRATHTCRCWPRNLSLHKDSLATRFITTQGRDLSLHKDRGWAVHTGDGLCIQVRRYLTVSDSFGEDAIAEGSSALSEFRCIHFLRTAQPRVERLINCLVCSFFNKWLQGVRFVELRRIPSLISKLYMLVD